VLSAILRPGLAFLADIPLELFHRLVNRLVDKLSASQITFFPASSWPKVRRGRVLLALGLLAQVLLWTVLLLHPCL
jgi:hypothetical protein